MGTIQNGGCIRPLRVRSLTRAKCSTPARTGPRPVCKRKMFRTEEVTRAEVGGVEPSVEPDVLGT